MRTYRFESLDSTSLKAARYAVKGDHGPLWICAAKQTAGRGRSGREWVSEPGNLYATHLLPVRDDPQHAALHSFAACLAVVDTLRVLVAKGSPSIALKWPNDVLFDGRKIAGVLLESGVTEAGRWLSIGIGLNLADAPQNTRWPTISVAEAAGRAAPNVEAALAILAAAMAVRVDQLAQKGFAPIRADWLKKAVRLGERIEARLPHETILGVFETLDDDGAMVLQTETGPRRIHAGEVYFPEGADASGH